MDGPRELRDAVRRLMVAHGALQKATRPCGTQLPMPTAYALLELLDSDGTLTVTALAERLAIDRTNVSRLCARLQQSGDIALVSHPRDGRARVVRLTPAGKRLARRVDRASATYFSSVASHLGAATQQTARAMERVRIAMAKAQEES